jgi:hypothetical protein
MEVMAMTVERKDPAALAGAHRVGVIKLAGKNDSDETTPPLLDLQVRKVLEMAPVSHSLAAVIAVLAFSQGRPS